MKKIAVILAGCGVYDGSEIQESVLTLLSIAQHQAAYSCFALDEPQHHVINHQINCEQSEEKRNILVEASRISRGCVQSLDALTVDDFDAVIVPGGFGVVKHLCNFSFKGSEMELHPTVHATLSSFAQAKKPMGLICIASVMVSKIFDTSVQCTIGEDVETSKVIEHMGAIHVPCAGNDIVLDAEHKLVTTPAYMLANNICDVYQGINKLVKKILMLTEL